MLHVGQSVLSNTGLKTAFQSVMTVLCGIGFIPVLYCSSMLYSCIKYGLLKRLKNLNVNNFCKKIPEQYL